MWLHASCSYSTYAVGNTGPILGLANVCDQNHAMEIHLSCFKVGIWFMVFNATFNNISVLSWRSVLLVEETGVPGENHRPATSY